MRWYERLSATLRDGQTVINREGETFTVCSTDNEDFKFLRNVDQSLKYRNMVFKKDGSYSVSVDGYTVSTIGGHFGRYPNPRDVESIINN